MNAMDVARWLQLEKYSLVRSKLQTSKSRRTSNGKSKEREIAVADGPVEEIAAPPPPHHIKTKELQKEAWKKLTQLKQVNQETVTTERVKATRKKGNEDPEKEKTSRRKKKKKEKWSSRRRSWTVGKWISSSNKNRSVGEAKC